MGRVTQEEARKVLGVGPYATLGDIKSAYKKLALVCHPDKMENSPETTMQFQRISAAYKRLSANDDSDELDIDEDYTYKLFREMFQSERHVLRVSTEHGSVLVLGRRYSTRRRSHSSDEDFDSSHYSFRKEATSNEGDTLNGETTAQKKADKKRMKKKRQRENKRQAKETLMKQREEIKHERQKEKVSEMKTASVQKDNCKKENENKNLPKGKNLSKLPVNGKTANHKENQQQDYKKSFSQYKHKYVSNYQVNSKSKPKISTHVSENVQDSVDFGSDAEVNEQEDADIDMDCAFFAKTLKLAQKKAPTVTKKQNNQPNQSPTEKKTTEPSNKESHPDREAVSVSNSQQIAVEGNKKATEGNFVQAIALFSQAIDLNSSDHRFFGNRSFCFEKLLQFEKALHDAVKAIELAPTWSKGYFRKGRALVGLKKYTDAEKSFEYVLKLDKHCHDADTELYHIRIKRLQEMGFSQQQSVLAIRKYTTVNEALEAVLSGALPDLAREDVYVSDEEEEEETYLPTPNTVMNPNPPKQPLERECGSSIWIGNVTTDVTESHLYRYFIQFGPILNIKINYNKLYAFVNFIDADSATTALKLQQRVQMFGTNLVLSLPERKPFVPNRMQGPRHRINTPQSHIKEFGTDYRRGVKECYFWRNTGCYNGPKCRFLHIPEHQGIDSC